MEVDIDKKCPTGIKGFDEIVSGGLPRNRTILLTGECGTGKTIFATEFIYKGVTKYNEPGVLVLLEQNPDEFKEDMMEFNFDLEKLEKGKKLIIMNASLRTLGLGEIAQRDIGEGESYSLLPGEVTLDNLVNVILSAAERINARRVSIDSLPALDILMEGKKDVRRMILSMNYKLKESGLTTVLISETDDEHSSTYGVERYVVDGIIKLYYSTIGQSPGRILTIEKMRKTKHSEDMHSMHFINGEGIEVVQN
ncbi:MAG: ATPase domain-containing protein [Candidatus Altiarchaeota archaeon]